MKGPRTSAGCWQFFLGHRKSDIIVYIDRLPLLPPPPTPNHNGRLKDQQHQQQRQEQQKEEQRQQQQRRYLYLPMVRAHMRGCAVAMIIRNRIANNTVRPVTVCSVFCDPSCSGFLLKEPGIRCAILASSTKMLIFLYILLENNQKHGVLIKNSHGN